MLLSALRPTVATGNPHPFGRDIFALKAHNSNSFPAHICTKYCDDKLCILQLSTSIDTEDYVEAGAVIPVHQKAAGIIDTVDGAKGTNRWSLLVIHLKQLHTGAIWILLTQELDLFFTRKSHGLHLL